MKLPLLISVPHAGLQVPHKVRDICMLTPEQIYDDSDGGAAEIYYYLDKFAEGFVSSDIARAIVDLNRAVDDFRKDGVIKTHTCHDIPVYKKFPSQRLIKQLLKDYYYPYHEKLKKFSDPEKIMVGIDCHTMVGVGPPVGPDAGEKRPLVCVSNADETCPNEWLQALADCFQSIFPHETVKMNAPFKGGYIIRSHSVNIPWVQIELSRTERITNSNKRDGVFEALYAWFREISE